VDSQREGKKRPQTADRRLWLGGNRLILRLPRPEPSTVYSTALPIQGKGRRKGRNATVKVYFLHKYSRNHRTGNKMISHYSDAHASFFGLPLTVSPMMPIFLTERTIDNKFETCYRYIIIRIGNDLVQQSCKKITKTVSQIKSPCVHYRSFSYALSNALALADVYVLVHALRFQGQKVHISLYSIWLRWATLFNVGFQDI
jgi:hypothetical protein